MLAALAAQIAAFTGQPVTLDARLAPPPCREAPAIAWVPPGRGAVSVTCAVPGWQLFVPVANVAVAAAPTIVRRGDIVDVVSGGAGFQVSVSAVAEADAAAGSRLRLRNRATGGRLQAVVGPHGELRLPGL